MGLLLGYYGCGLQVTAGEAVWPRLGRMILCALLLGAATSSGQVAESIVDLTTLSLEELMEVEVTTVAKKEQPLFEAPAAVYVIAQEDIRRSGFTHLAEVLRLAPGLQVAQIDASKWAVSARGFNDRFANKLLVLVDGRIVYTSLFSGVFWEVQDLVLEDVARIEVIRGPGAALWGANAVNGVINIITKNAQDTRGGLVVAGAGSEDRGMGVVRYGGRLAETAHYRVYARYGDRDQLIDRNGEQTNDAWQIGRGGFRLDWQPSGRDALILMGDVYDGDLDQTLDKGAFLEPPYTRMFDFETRISGASVLGRWERSLSAVEEVKVGLYYERSDRSDVVLSELRNTVDLDFQHRFKAGGYQDIVWGLGYRFSSDDVDSTFVLSVHPADRQVQIFSAFVQDEFRFAAERLRLTLGTKFERNDFTGIEVQPSGRLLWMPHRRHVAWSAVSRAVRLPTRAESDGLFIQQVSPVEVLGDSLLSIVKVMGNPDFESEKLLAFEGGYRTRPTDWLTLDLAGFYNVYDDLRTGEPQNSITDFTKSPPHLIIPVLADNKASGRTFGIEKAVDCQVFERWRLRAAYTYLWMDVDIDRDSQSTGTETIPGKNPGHQFNLRSALDLPAGLGLDLIARGVGGVERPKEPNYWTVDFRLGWRPRPALEVVVAGQNLLDSPRHEFRAELIESPLTQIQRSLYGALKWRF